MPPPGGGCCEIAQVFDFAAAERYTPPTSGIQHVGGPADFRRKTTKYAIGTAIAT